MKLTNVQIKQIIKEEVRKTLFEAEEKTPEEKAASLEQQNALKYEAVKQLNRKKFKINEREYHISAEYFKKDSTTGKPRHVEVKVSYMAHGYKFDVSYDAKTKNYVITLNNLSREGEADLLYLIKSMTKEALEKGIPEEGLSFISSSSTVAYRGDTDYEGDDRYSEKNSYNQGWVALPYSAKGSKWRA